LKGAASLLSLFLLCSCATTVTRTSERLGSRCEKIKTVSEIEEHEDDEGNSGKSEKLLAQTEVMGRVSEDCEGFTSLTLLANSRSNDAIGMMSAIALLDMATRQDEKARRAMAHALTAGGQTMEGLLQIKVAGFVRRFQDADKAAREAAARELLLIHRRKIHADIASAPQIVDSELALKGYKIADLERLNDDKLWT